MVPIHTRIRPLVKKWYEASSSIGCEYLFNYKHARRYNEGEHMTYDKLRRNYRELVNKLGLNPKHKTHDGRVQFVTMAKKANVDEYALKYMVGHSITDITERVYTKRDENWLAEEIEKIK
jgi:integrase